MKLCMNSGYFITIVITQYGFIVTSGKFPTRLKTISVNLIQVPKASVVDCFS